MRIGIDLGGTKIEAMLMAANGEDRARRRVATPAGSYAATLDMITSLVSELDTIAGRTCPVGLATPGALSPATALIKNANSVWLNGQPLARDLAHRLGPRVRLANDADCFALSEATDGAGRGYETVFGVILGTGVGGGLVVGGRLVGGPNAICGEWGHTPLPWPSAAELPGPQCYCGQRGCVETWCSGPALAADHARATPDHTTPDHLTPERIAQLAAAGDLAAQATLDRHADRLARALAVVITILDPHAIVLGGGLSALEHLYTAIPSRLPRYVFSDTVITPVLKNKHGASSGIRGAAWLWPPAARGA